MATTLVGTGIICDSCGAECLKQYNGCTPGYGSPSRDSDEKYCFACCERLELAAFTSADRYTAYLGCGEKSDRIVTWTGGILGRVIAKRLTRKPCSMGGYFYYVRAIGPNGSRWSGYTPGNGCYVNLRRLK